MSVSPTEFAVVNYDIHPIDTGNMDAARWIVESQLTESAGYFERSSEDWHAYAAISEQGEMLGVSCITYPEDEDASLHLQYTRTATLEFLAVDEPYQSRHGIGSTLLKYSEYVALNGGLEEMFLESVDPAESFYKRHGYRVVPLRERKDERNEWLIPMTKRLRAVRPSDNTRPPY
jgi:ribosomal protein S18 acetylase RimI-like enzyme